MGGDRYEQLFRASGFVRLAGEAEHTFIGSGLRIRRQGVRHLAELRGHCWQPRSSRAARPPGNYLPPRKDGRPTFYEGYLFDGDGELIPAGIIEAPWLTKIEPLNEDVSVVVETDRGTLRIEGETVLSTYDIHHADKTFSTEQLKQEQQDCPALQQAGVWHRWYGEETHGMLERSSPMSKIGRG